MKVSVTDYTVDGKCSGCGQCCSNFLPLSDDDVRAIHRSVKKHPVKEQRHNAMTGVDATCPFRDEAHKQCLIYDVRPAMCRSFQCNYTIADLEKNKLDFHRRCVVVDMRMEFFGNDECQPLMMNYQRSVTKR